jgi:hypothetical protein
VWRLSENVEALAGARIPAECGRRSRTQQISRKRSYKTWDLRGHKSLMAITPPAGPFFGITRKEVTRSAKLTATPVPCWHLNAEEFSKSFGGRLAQIRAIRARTPTRRAWSSTEEFAFVVWQLRPRRLRAVNALPLPARCLRGERAGGEGPRRRRGRFTSLDGGSRLNATKIKFLVRQIFCDRSRQG